MLFEVFDIDDNGDDADSLGSVTVTLGSLVGTKGSQKTLNLNGKDGKPIKSTIRIKIDTIA